MECRDVCRIMAKECSAAGLTLSFAYANTSTMTCLLMLITTCFAHAVGASMYGFSYIKKLIVFIIKSLCIA